MRWYPLALLGAFVATFAWAMVRGNARADRDFTKKQIAARCREQEGQ